MGSAGASEPPKGAAKATVMETEKGETVATVLSRASVIRRRKRNAEELAKYYRNEYWTLMEEVRVRHRDYYWEYGKSPFEDEDNGGGDDEPLETVGQFRGESEEKRDGVGLGLGFGGKMEKKKGERCRCVFAGCKSKAMPLSRFCHSHILSDNEQTLYKPCIYVMKK